MSENGAYGSEMQEAAIFESALRAAVPARPDPGLGAALVPRLAEAARLSTVEAETRRVRRRPRSRRALVARVGVAVAAIPLLLAGLAFAGVTVPEPARSVFHSVGITLPNQPASHSTGTSTTQQSSGQPSGTATTETPQSQSPKAAAPSKGNSANAHKHALEQHGKAQGKAVGHGQGKAIGLNGSTPPGQSGQTGSPEHSNAGGSSGSHGQSSHSSPKPHPTHVPQGNAKGHSK